MARMPDRSAKPASIKDVQHFRKGKNDASPAEGPMQAADADAPGTRMPKSAPEDHCNLRKEVPSTEQIIREALDYKKLGLDAFDIPRQYLIKLFCLIEQLSESINVAFAGQLFDNHFPPDHWRNRKRAMAYIDLQGEVCKLLGYAITLWMLSYGMKLGDDWAAIVVEDMRLKHATRMAGKEAKGEEKSDPVL
jgi:hypothetical protein